MTATAGIPIAYSEYAKLMFDLEFLAFQADLTRITTFMYGREVSVRMYDELGLSETITRCRSSLLIGAIRRFDRAA